MGICLAQSAPTATVLAADIVARRRDAVEVVEQALDRLAACDAQVRAFVHVDPDAALAEARQRADDVRRGKPLGPLHGVPVGVKDLVDVAGQLTRAGSQLPPGPPARHDAAMVARLRAAGAVVLGRTRTHEFAWGLTTQHTVLGGTRNPWDTDRVAGGSSGGSAAAVAAGVVPLALGTDTGCSIRLPAAWCGLVGHKPTYAWVSLAGVVPLAPSLDHGGALVRDVVDARLALQVLSGRDLPPAAPLSGLRLGVASDDGLLPLAATVRTALERAADRARQVGLVVSAVSLPLADRLAQVYATLSGAEALRWHRSTGRWPAHAEEYGEDVRVRLRLAGALTAEQVAAAEAIRARLRSDLTALFQTVDLLLLPVAAAGPPHRSDPDRVEVDGASVPLRDAVLPATVLANLAGLPACAVPAGQDPAGWPVGVQVVGPPGTDALVLDAAAALAEAAT